MTRLCQLTLSLDWPRTVSERVNYCIVSPLVRARQKRDTLNRGSGKAACTTVLCFFFLSPSRANATLIQSAADRCWVSLCCALLCCPFSVLCCVRCLCQLCDCFRKCRNLTDISLNLGEYHQQLYSN